MTSSGEVSGSTTTISPEVGLTPESAWMFAPCVTTISVPSVHVFKIAVASRLSSSRPISQHESVAKSWLDVHGPKIHQFCRFNAAAPGRTNDCREGYAVRPDLCAHSDCVRAPSLAEIPLSGAVIELEAWWIAGSARSISMTHQRDVSAFAQGLPSDRRVRRRGRHGNYEGKDSYDLEHTEEAV
jgi:hypothetical protein